jgi:hypothetical protein
MRQFFRGDYMKKIIVVFVCVVLLFSCNKNNKGQDSKFENESVKGQVENNKIENDSTKEQIQNIIKEVGNKQNPLYGKIYRDITDIPECKQWEERGGTVIRSNGSYGLSIVKDENGNCYFLFEEFVKSTIDGKTNYKILDTINVGKLKDHEIAEFHSFSLNGIYDYEIIGVLSIYERSDDALYGEIINVWRADCNTGIIIPIDTEGVDYTEIMDMMGRPFIKRKKDR